MRKSTVQGEFYGSVLATNIRRLAGGSVNAWALKHDLNQTTINRIANGSMDTKASTLEQIAQKTGYAAWQLLHPEFDPMRMPPMMDPETMRVAAIFAATTGDRRQVAAAVMEQFAPATMLAETEANRQPQGAE